ncbi:MAG: aminotransferase class I/II-fold pyridoxal phosphate-dependent enzyme [Myxococcales bacterium]|nr:aminotransferase class I/II-fold pyridoxal phosphate-dependent enzyme [Myxococcales bacterium]
MRRPRFTPLLEAIPATVPFVAPDALERRGHRIAVRLGANESAFGVSPRAAEAMVRAVPRQSWYADPESFELRDKLAGLLDVTRAHLLVGSGIDELLGLVVRCFVAPGEVAVMARGSYPTFAYHVIGHGGLVEAVPYRDDAVDLETLAEAATRRRARLVYLANPDNPSGSWHTPQAVEALVERLPADCVLVLDEAYLEFAPRAPELSADDPRVLRVRTFSKLYGMAGARIGYAVAPPEVVAAFDKVRLHFGVNGVAQAGAQAALDDREFAAGVIAEVARGRQEYAALGRELALPTLPSATNVVLFDLGGAARARGLLDALLAEGIFIRMPGAPPLDRAVRVTVGTPDERARFAAALRAMRTDGRLEALGER